MTGTRFGDADSSSAGQMLVEATAAPGGVFEGDLETDQDPDRVGFLVVGIGELERHRSIRLVSRPVSRDQFAAATIPFL